MARTWLVAAPLIFALLTVFLYCDKLTQDASALQADDKKMSDKIDQLEHQIDKIYGEINKPPQSTSTASNHVAVTAGKFAYVYYATDEKYMCSALVNLARLKSFGIGSGIDLVLMLPANFNAPEYLLANLRTIDGVVRRVPAAPKLDNSYYADVLVKLRVFELEEYTRIIYMDADSLVLRKMDELFLLPSAPLVASRSYWISPSENGIYFSTMLMVIEPSAKEAQKAWELVPKVATPFDMDILNAVYGKSCMLLPIQYAMLTSHWEVNNPHPLSDDLTYLLDEKVYMVHFTGPGKPWTIVGGKGAVRARPNSHSGLAALYQMWHDGQRTICNKVS